MVMNGNVPCHLQQCKCPDQDLWAPLYINDLGANKQSSVLVNSVRQNTLPTRKAFPEKTTTCIWLTVSYEAWYCTILIDCLFLM